MNSDELRKAKELSDRVAKLRLKKPEPKKKIEKKPVSLAPLLEKYPYKPKDGANGRDGSPDTPEQIAGKLNTLEKALDYKVINGAPTVEDIIKELKVGGKNQLELRDIKGARLDMNDQRWHGGGLSQVVHDDTLQGTGTASSPLSTTITETSTTTFTNKRITKRSDTVTSASEPTIDTDSVDYYSITAQSGNITSMTTNLSGAPTEGQTLWVSITAASGTPSISWGVGFEDSTTTLPTTLSTTRQDIGLIWNSVSSKWRCVAVA